MVRDQDVDLKFQSSLLNAMLKDSDLFKIRQRSSWNEETKEWSVPHFLLTDKKTDVAFPTINAKQRVDQVREDRSVTFDRAGSDVGSHKSWFGNLGGHSNVKPAPQTVYDGMMNDGEERIPSGEEQYFWTKNEFREKASVRQSNHKPPAA